MLEPTPQTFQATAVQLNYVEWPSNSPPLVVVHGNTSRWQGHAAYIERLIDDYHVFAVDQAGHGGSGRRNGPYRIVDLADDMAEFLPAVVGSDWAFLGLSLGALVGIEVAGRDPELIKALVLGDPPWSLFGPSYLKTGMPAARAAMKEELLAGVDIKEEAKKIASGDPSLTEEQVRSRAMARKQFDPNALDPTIDGTLYQGFDYEASLKSIKAATLLLQADDQNGGVLGDDDACRIVDLVEDIEAVKFPTRNHGLDYGSPAGPFDIITGFLRRRHPGD